MQVVGIVIKDSGIADRAFEAHVLFDFGREFGGALHLNRVFLLEAFDSRNRFLKAVAYLSTPEKEVMSRPEYS